MSSTATVQDLELLAQRLATWRAEPDVMVRELFDATPDPWQDKVLRDFPSSTRISMVACTGPGKSTILSWLIWNFLITRPHPKVAATSITGPNLRDNLWTELKKWMEASPLVSTLFEWTDKRIVSRQYPKTWFAAARTWNRDADPEAQGTTLAGIHADYVLFVLDEAGGIPDSVAAAAEGGLSTGIEAKMILAGNPTHLSGPLHRSATSARPLYSLHEITGDPDDPNRAPRVSGTWAREMIKLYGKESSFVQVKVFGRFPEGTTDALISIATFKDAVSRWPIRRRLDLALEPRVLGVDVARFGNDRTVVARRAGDLLIGFEEWVGHDTMYTAGRVAEIGQEWGAESYQIDDIGVGGGVVDRLQEDGLEGVWGVNAAGKANDPKKHINLRSELNLALQERFARGYIAINPDIEEETTLMAEGTNLRTRFSGARRAIEPKEKFKARTGMSPDYWDAAVLAYNPAATEALIEFG
jgi:hypothetical protein